MTEVALDGAFNARELGGHEAAGGRRIRRGALYRSSALHEMSSAARLGVRTVLDLRGPTDVTRDSGRLGPVREHADVRRICLPMLPAEVSGRPTSEYLSDAFGRVVSADRYRGYVELSADSIRDLFAQLSRADAFPALVHCTAGKDRTGVLIALILDVVGVSHAAIVSDYARSHASASILAEHLGKAVQLTEAHMALLGAPAEAMEGFLGWLHAEHGSARGYLTSIGVERSAFDTLETALLEA